MATYQLHHIHHETTDVDATAAFYQENFSAELTERFERDGVQWARLNIGGASLNVTDRGKIDVPLGLLHGLDHFCLRTSDFDETVAALKANGVHFFTEPKSPRPGTQVAFVSGPDNVKIEILHIGG